MTDAVERVARALDPECFEDAVVRVYGDLWAYELQAKARRQARAAILALREPTPEMLQAACDATFCPDPLTPETAHRIGWTAAIDAALGDPA